MQEVPANKDGTSLYDLKSFLEKQGFRVEAARIRNSEVRDLPGLSILYLRPRPEVGHFVVYIGGGRIVDPPQFR
jgi:hypothetical protein